MTRRRILLALIAIGAVPTALALFRPPEARRMDVERVERREVRPTVLASGILAYEEQAQLTAEVLGKVSEVLVKEGDVVARGQVILRISAEALKAEAEQQEAALRQHMVNLDRQQIMVANQERELARLTRLRAAGMVEENKFDAARFQLDLAVNELRAQQEALRTVQARLALAREQLSKTAIRAPLAGRVTQLAIRAGETAVPASTNIAGSSLATIANVTSILAEVNVDEADVAGIASGQEGSIFAAALPDRPFAARVESVALAPRQSAHGQGRSFVVRMRLTEPPDAALRSGMSCRAEIFSGRRENALAVPVQAVLVTHGARKGADGARHVLVVVDGRAQMRAVDLGMTDDNHVQVRSGLREGDAVIVGPERELKALAPGERIAYPPREPRP